MANGLFDIADYGGVPGTNCDAAVEAAYQAALAYNKPSVIHFPAGTWPCSRPLVFDLTETTIRGEGRGATTLSPSGAYSPLFFGIRRTPMGQAIVAGHRPDAAGKVSFAGAGQYAGYRTMGNAHVGMWECPFDRGASDGWKSTRSITLCWMSEGGILRFGMLMPGDLPNPWVVLEVDATTQAFKFRDSSGVTRSCTWTIPGDPTALRRHAFQIDLVAGTWQAYCDGFQRGAGTVPAGLSFLRSHNGVFGIGMVGPTLAMVAGTQERTFYAMRLSAGPTYHNDGVDLPTRRIDGAASSDGQYYSTTTDLMACLMITLPLYTGTRLVSYKIGEAASEGPGYVHNTFGLFLHSGVQGGGSQYPERQYLRDLTITLGGKRWGQALTVGGVLGLGVKDVNLTGGWNGIGAAPMGACWPTTLLDIMTQGYDSSLYLSVHTLLAERIDCAWAGTTAMRLEGCSGTIKDIWVNGQTVDRAESTIEITGLDDPSFLTLDGIRVNQEGYPYPTVAGIRATPGKDTKPLPMRLTLRDILWGNVGPDASLIRLEDGPPPSNTHKCHFMLHGSHMETSEVGVVTTGPRWIGTVDPGPHGEIDWLVHDGPGESGLELIGSPDGGGGATSMASLMYNSARVKIQDGTIDLNTDTIHAMLVTAAYVADKDAHATRADVTGEVVGAGYTAGGMPLANKTVTQDNANDRGKFDADDVTWPAATITARGAVIYKSRGGAPNLDELIDFCDFGSDISSTNGAFTLQFHADGIHHIG